MGRKIDVMIVGAQKAGTTSLLRYLGEHPECVSHPQKEFAYFIDTSEYHNSYKNAFQKYFGSKDIDQNQKIIAKSAGLYADEAAVKRLHEHNPNCKIVLILRNPIERAYSSYLMEKNYGTAKFEFNDLPELIRKHKQDDESWGFSFFIDYGLYANYIKMIYKYFPENQVSVFLYRNFRKDPLSVCKTVFNKIGVDDTFIPNVEVKHNVTLKNRSTTFARATKHILRKDSIVRKALMLFIPNHKAYKYGEFLREMNKTKDYYEGMNAEIRNFLIEFYKPHNRELEKMLGQDLSDWDK